MIDRKIIISNGWEPNQNHALAEVVIPSTIETLNAPRKVTFLGKTLNYIPSTNTALQEFEAPNCTTITDSLLKSYTNLTSLKLQSLTSIIDSGANVGLCHSCTKLAEVNLDSLATLSSACDVWGGKSGAFYNCTTLASVSLPSLTSLTSSSSSGGGCYVGAFYNCTGLISISLPALTSLSSYAASGDSRSGAFLGCTALTSVSLPSLTTISSTGGGGSGISGAFALCTGLKTVSLPKLATATESSSTGGTFKGCTSLETVQLGSEGNAVTSIGAYMFYGCTQSGLTITVYTSGGAALANAPWGATNATIVYEEA